MADLKVLSYNVNGVRSAIKKGLLDWLKEMDADVVCLQELKADDGAFDTAAFQTIGYHSYTFPAEKKGYSGVAVYTKEEPKVCPKCKSPYWNREKKLHYNWHKTHKKLIKV